LTALHADADVARCKVVQKHSGKARLRNRAKKIKVGPLIVTGNKGASCYKAFRNLAGVQTVNVFSLDLLKLAPGGHLGRFIIWTKAAFEQLNAVFGSANKPSEIKRGYFLPRPVLANPDIRRIIQSDAIQAVRNAKPARFKKSKRINFLANKRAMAKINPYSVHERQQLANIARNRIKARLALAAAPKKTKKHAKVQLKRALDGQRLKKGEKGRKANPKFAPRYPKYKRIVFKL